MDVFIKNVNGEKRLGGYCTHNGYLYLASPADNQVLAIDMETGTEQVLTIDTDVSCGCMWMASDGTELWLLPYSGYTITSWNPVNGETHVYSDYPEGLVCTHIFHGYECMEYPFIAPAFCGDYVYFPPQWANMFIRLNKVTGEMTEWKPEQLA